MKIKKPWNVSINKAATMFGSRDLRVIIGGKQPILTEMLGESIRRVNAEITSKSEPTN